MSWDPTTWDLDLQAWFKALIRLRRTSPALIDGGFQVLALEPDTLIYQRDCDEETVLVVAYRGEGTKVSALIPVSDGAIPDGLVFEELFTHQRATVENGYFPLPAMFKERSWVGLS
jgi:glycosidase